MKKGIVLATLAAATLALAGSAASMGRYTDRTGDSGAAPDITAVTVSGDNASGQIVLHVDAEVALGADARTWVFIDSDANPATGDASMLGSDYAFRVNHSRYSFAFGHWYGSEWDNAPTSATVLVAITSRGAIISVNRSVLGNTSEFNFWAETEAGDGGAGELDRSPDQGQWNYSFAADGPNITGARVTTAPASGPRAGKRFAITNIALQLPPTMGLQVTPKPDSYSCTATLAGKRLAARGCSWQLPKKSRGKRLAVRLTVQYQGATKTFPLSFVVR